MSTKSKIEKAILKSFRESQKSQGFFDGRFRNRTEPNKKAVESKRACKVKISF